MIILLTKFTIWLLRLRGGGSSFPGKLALKFSPNILKKLVRGWNVILVTGTNGKTTTSHMIFNILKDSGYTTINNSAGANMLTGIVTCFADAYRFFNQPKDGYAVIEVDEAFLPIITKKISPHAIVVTNIFKDQMDRYGEVSITYNYILNGIKNAPNATLILNGDEPLLGHLPVGNEAFYYGFENYQPAEGAVNEEAICLACQGRYTYESVTFAHLGNYNCQSCKTGRPKLAFGVNKNVQLNPEGSTFAINDKLVNLSVPGLYNIYNGLAAFATGVTLGLSEEKIVTALEANTNKFGRFETVQIKETEAKLLLVKNPTGCNQCIDTVSLDKEAVNLVFLLNDNYGDGQDVSWIYDANFEKLMGMSIKSIIIGGTRPYDMAIRLKNAGLDKANFTICQNEAEVLHKLKEKSGKTYVFFTYTAMLSFRATLTGGGYIQ